MQFFNKFIFVVLFRQLFNFGTNIHVIVYSELEVYCFLEIIEILLEKPFLLSLEICEFGLRIVKLLSQTRFHFSNYADVFDVRESKNTQLENTNSHVILY